jgi:CHAD domain-containing protein
MPDFQHAASPGDMSHRGEKVVGRWPSICNLPLQMAYRFKHSQTVPENIKRIAAEEIGSAIAHLRAKCRTAADESIHETRKNIKKTRALVRLVRPEPGHSYRDENAQLRDIGRQLSQLRDAGALMGVLDNLRKRSHNGAGKSLVTVRKLLAQQKQRLEEEAETRKLKPALASDLLRARKSIKYWPLEADGFSAIEAGLEKTFRNGRNAMTMARKSGRREDFHEWRKRVKDLWYHVRLLKKLWGEKMEGHDASLKELEEALGEDLNLAILAERVRSLASKNGDGLKAAQLARTIDAARTELRNRALEIGARVYSQKPREFMRQIKRLWKAL